ncbi:PEP-CTERM sorting domain-containing protein [Colwellia sp. MEBiC06753]
MNFKRKLLTGTALLMLGGFANLANAASVSSIMSATGDFLLEDDSGEYHIDVDGDGVLSVGDKLRGIIEWPKLTSGGDEYLLDGIANEHLSAIFETEVTGKFSAGIPGLFNFTFGPSASFAVDFGFNAGTMVAMFTDSVDNVNIKGASCDEAAEILPDGACEASVLDGTLAAELGFTGLDGDEGWLAFSSPDDTSAGASFGEASALGSFNYNLSLIASHTLGEFNKVNANFLAAGGIGAVDGKIDFTGSGTLLGILNSEEQRVTAYDFTDDADIQGNKVPEPSTIALFGLTLLGLARIKRSA